ncbi:hypothetical protein PMI41_02510 [Phyllobacterium sp. YR531]|nr:hypothetical protein PMI41_02510 [Phyllobacterium sp. YR531]
MTSAKINAQFLNEADDHVNVEGVGSPCEPFVGLREIAGHVCRAGQAVQFTVPRGRALDDVVPGRMGSRRKVSIETAERLLEG